MQLARKRVLRKFHPPEPFTDDLHAMAV